MQAVPPRTDSRGYWDRAAATQPAWFIATGHQAMDAAFFEHGGREVDELLTHCGVAVQPGDRLLEIGCGAGRMPAAWPSSPTRSSLSTSARTCLTSLGATSPTSAT